MLPWILLLGCGLLSCGAGPSSPKDVNPELAHPLGSLFSLTIRNYFIASRWNQPGTANVVEFQSVIPFEVWKQKNLTRLSVPFRTQSELGPGLSDVRLFDLLVFPTRRGFWGVGPVFNLGINRGPGVDALQGGPAAAFVIAPTEGLRVGFLNQNFFNEQVAFSALQPILSYQAGNSWTIGLGELPLVYNWNTDQFAVLSLGLQVGLLVQVAKQPVRFFVNPQFNTRSSTQLYQWTIAFGMTLPLKPVGSTDELR